MKAGASISLAVALVVIVGAIVGETLTAPRGRRRGALLRAVLPWGVLLALGVYVGLQARGWIAAKSQAEMFEWKTPRAFWLWPAPLFVGLLVFHLQRRRTATIGFSQTQFVQRRGWRAWLVDLPGVLRVVAVGALVVALMRPESYRMVKTEQDSIDIMIVFDMSKSMEEADLPRNRLDAAQRVVRRFLRRTPHDRVGLVVFGQQAMLQCPLTQDEKLVEDIVRDLMIGDVPALGTAIGDGLALALAQLRRSDGTCDGDHACGEGLTCSTDGYCKSGKNNKVVILLSDGDSNWTTRFEPDEAARTARDMGVKVYTVLVGREGNDFFGFGGSVNPATLRSIAQQTGGQFFRATDYESFDKGFQTVRNTLDKTKRTTVEKVPGEPIYIVFVLIAAGLVLLELLLTHTVLRRLP